LKVRFWHFLKKLDKASEDAYDQGGRLIFFTLPVAKILSFKNVRAWFSMVSYSKKKKKN
jgi:hypothetical protein